MYKNIEEYIKKIKNPKEDIVEILIMAQENLGKLNSNHIQHLSKLCDISPEEIRDTIEFFPFLIGDTHIIRVCTGFNCSMKGARSIINILKEEDIQVEETSCSGLCKSSPNIWVDDGHQGNIDFQTIKKIIKKIKK